MRITEKHATEQAPAMEDSDNEDTLRLLLDIAGSDSSDEGSPVKRARCDA